MRRRLRRNGSLRVVESALGPERDVHQPNEGWHFDEWTDDAGERFTRRHAERPDRHRDRELEVVSRGSKRQGRTLRIGQAQADAQRERAGPHDRKVD